MKRKKVIVSNFDIVVVVSVSKTEIHIVNELHFSKIKNELTLL